MAYALINNQTLYYKITCLYLGKVVILQTERNKKKMSDNEINYKEELFITELKDIVNSTRQLVCSAINYAQVRQNWLIGQKIVVQEQKGKTRAEYGKQIIKVASLALTEEFGRGFSVTNLKATSKNSTFVLSLYTLF